jgi:hypothetical protein
MTQMKEDPTEKFYGLPLPAPAMPDDFARRVIRRARAEQRRQRLRRGYAFAVAILLITAIPLATLLGPTHDQLATRNGSATGPLGSQSDPFDTADAAQLAQATAPDQLSDYLMPNTAPLRTFTATYSDAAWNYDPNWTSYR